MTEPFNPDEWRLLKTTLAEFGRRLTRLEQIVVARGFAGATLPAESASPTDINLPTAGDETARVDEDEVLPPTAVPLASVESATTRAPLRDAIGRALEPSPPPEQVSKPAIFASKESLEKLIGGRWFTWLGAASLALAVAFFVPWAWRHFQLPPWMRVLIFHLAGVGILTAAYLLQRKRLPVLAHGLAGLGIFTLYASAFAMEYHYRLWGAYSTYATLADCTLITAAAIAVAVRYNSPYIVGLGALGGYVTPLVSARGPAGFSATFIYLAFLNAALLVTATIRPWRILKPLAVAAAAAMFLIWIYGSRPPLDAWQVEWMLVLHALLFLAGTTAPPLLGQRSLSADLAALAGNSLWFVYGTWLVFHFRTDQQMAAVCWGMSALHAALFGLIYGRLTNADRMPRVHLALAAVFLTLAVPLQLRDTLSYLAYAWAVEGFVFTAIGIYFRDRQMAAAGAIVLCLAAVRALAFDFVAPPETMGASAIDRRMLVLLGVGLAVAAAGSCYWWVAVLAPPRDEPLPDRRAGAILMAIGNVIAMIGLTCQWDGRIVLFLWTLDAAALWSAAFWRPNSALRAYAVLLSVVMVGGRVVYHGASLSEPFELLTNERFISLALVAVLYLRAGWFERTCRLRAPQATGYELAAGNTDVVLHVLGNLVMLAALSLEIHDVWRPAQVTSAATWTAISMQEHLTYSVVWTAYSTVLFAWGLAMKYPLPRQLGLGGLLAVAAKALLLDLATDSLGAPFALLANERFAALALVAAMCLVVGWFERRFRRSAPPPADGAAPPIHSDAVLHTSGNVVMLVALSLEVHSFWQGQGTRSALGSRASMEEMLSYSLTWAIYAATLVTVGFALKYRLPRLLGLGVLLAVTIKVISLDLAEIKLIYRVLILTALGGLLLITSFWYQRFTARIESTQPE